MNLYIIKVVNSIYSNYYHTPLTSYVRGDTSIDDHITAISRVWCSVEKFQSMAQDIMREVCKVLLGIEHGLLYLRHVDAKAGVRNNSSCAFRGYGPIYATRSSERRLLIGRPNDA